MLILLVHGTQFGQTPVYMWLWKYFSDVINISISRLRIKQIEGLKKKEWDPPMRQEFCLRTAFRLTRISRLLPCPVNFISVGTPNCMSQFLRIPSPPHTSPPPLSPFNTNVCTHVHTHTLLVLFLWRILIYNGETLLAFFIFFSSSKPLSFEKRKKKKRQISGITASGDSQVHKHYEYNSILELLACCYNYINVCPLTWKRIEYFTCLYILNI